MNSKTKWRVLLFIGSHLFTWVWAEATGRNNPFGQTPSNFIGKNLLAYEVVDEPIVIKQFPGRVEETFVERGGSFTYLNYSPSYQ
jgi:hypothetical protein